MSAAALVAEHASGPVRVAHLTSTHEAFDTRIFWKECRTLARAGYDVTLVAPHDSDMTRDDVRIVAVPRPGSRGERATLTAWRVFRAGWRSRAHVIHVHDPELLPWALLMKLLGRRVIYDAHENLPKDIRSKHYLPEPLRALLASVVDLFERAACACLDGVVAVTPGIASRFPRERTIVLRNFPLLAEFAAARPGEYATRRPIVLYLGGLNEIRGAREMVRAIGRVKDSLGAELWLAGRFDPPALQAQLAGEPGWARTRWLGWRTRDEVALALAASRIGLLVLHPVPNHLDSLPIKLFEYMAAGLPVVASRFPAWERLVDGAGAFVDPLDVGAIAAEIERLLENPEDAARMGGKGRAAIERELHWEREAASLVALYERITGAPRAMSDEA